MAKAFDYLAIVLDSFNIIKTYKNMYIKQKDGFSFDKDWSILFNFFKKPRKYFFNFFITLPSEVGPNCIEGIS